MGYNVNEVYASGKYLKAGDLNDQPVTDEIADVTLEQVGTDNKLVIYFKHLEKALVLNKTNSNTIALVYGMDTDGWIGATLTMYPTMVDFKGQSVESIRVKAKPRPSGQRQGASPFKKHFPDKGSYGTITSGPPRGGKRAPVQDDPRMAMADRDDPNDDIPF